MVTDNTKNHKRMRIRQTHTQTHTNHTKHSRGALLDTEKGTKDEGGRGSFCNHIIFHA